VPAQSVPALLEALLRADPGRPLVTFYDDASGERVELSVKSFANWVAKTANMVQAGLCAEPGEWIALSLPTHWQGAVWLCAAWSCGLVVTFERAEMGGADYVVVGPDPVPGDGPAGRTVGVSLRPMGGTLTTSAEGLVDYASEVLGYPDEFAATEAVAADTPALQLPDGLRTHAQLIEHATRVAAGLELGAVPRLLTDANPCSPGGYATALLAPLVTGGSVVLLRNPDPERASARVAQERVSAVSTGWVSPAG
jgi:uncharacterized protein (TIGR03089 family)